MQNASFSIILPTSWENQFDGNFALFPLLHTWEAEEKMKGQTGGNSFGNHHAMKIIWWLFTEMQKISKLFWVKMFALIVYLILKSISKAQPVRCRAPELLQQFFEVAGFLLWLERSWVEELIEAADSGQRSLGTLAVGDYIPQNSTVLIMMIREVVQILKKKIKDWKFFTSLCFVVISLLHD